MNVLKALWHDESGSVVSAELVLLGTLGVVGAGIGAAAVGDSVESELEEVAYSLRSLDQSYHVQGFKGCGAWTAGSSYTQPPVESSRAELRRTVEHRRAAEEERAHDGQRLHGDGERRPQDDERLRERRRRMRERELELRPDHDERWDGDAQREQRD